MQKTSLFRFSLPVLAVLTLITPSPVIADDPPSFDELQALAAKDFADEISAEAWSAIDDANIAIDQFNMLLEEAESEGFSWNDPEFSTSLMENTTVAADNAFYMPAVAKFQQGDFVAAKNGFVNAGGSYAAAAVAASALADDADEAYQALEEAFCEWIAEQEGP